MKNYLVLFLFVTITTSVLFGQTVLYVDAASGSNTSGNGSLANPFQTITKALSVSTMSGDSIRVAAGTYDVTLGEVFPIEMLSGRKLIGETKTNGSGSTIIDASGSINRVFNSDGNSNATIIQGFVITGGYAIDTSGPGATGKGGGINIVNGSQVIIQQNIITGNIARGYDFYQAGAGAVNGGTSYGGGIYISGGASPTIQNNVISNNIAMGGGGKDFRGGWSGNGSDGGNADGGGIHAAFGGATIIINNTFYENKSLGGLGGSSNSLNAGNGGNAIAGALNAGANAIVRNNIFSENQSVGGPMGGGANGSNGTSSEGAITSYTSANLSHNLYFNNTAIDAPNGNILGANNVMSDPLFVSVTNFHILPLSPARSAGISIGAPAKDFDGTVRNNPPSIGAFEGIDPTSANEKNISAPQFFELMQNYPNPFNPTTVISYQLPVNNLVTLKVYDAIGREVAILVNEVKEAGKYSVTLNAKNLSSGIYFAHLSSGGKSMIKKLVLMK